MRTDTLFYLDEVLAQSPDPGPGLGLIGLILAEPADSARQARELYRSAAAERAWILNWVETILVYKLPTLSREEIKMVLDLQEVDLKRSRFYQEIFAEGREEGHEEGRDQGVTEGRRSEARQLVDRLLRRRFQSLPAAIEPRLSALSLERLELLAEDILGFGSLDDLERWLGS